MENQKTEELGGDRGGGGPPKLEPKMATSEMSVPFPTVLPAQDSLRCHLNLPGKRPNCAHRRVIRSELIFHNAERPRLKATLVSTAALFAQLAEGAGLESRGCAALRRTGCGPAFRLSACHRRFKDRCSMKNENSVKDRLIRLNVAATH